MALADDTCTGTAEATRVDILLVDVGGRVAGRAAVGAIVEDGASVGTGVNFGLGVGAGVLVGDGSLIASSSGGGSRVDWNDTGWKTKVTARGIAPA